MTINPSNLIVAFAVAALDQETIAEDVEFYTAKAAELEEIEAAGWDWTGTYNEVVWYSDGEAQYTDLGEYYQMVR